MCDYSLETYQSRPARIGEQYVTHRFPSHGVGFISPGDPKTAVCMECGMSLRLENLPERIQTQLGVKPEETVTFVRLEKGPFHDGLQFGSGKEVTLQDVGPGVKGSLIEDMQPMRMESEHILIDYRL